MVERRVIADSDEDDDDFDSPLKPVPTTAVAAHVTAVAGHYVDGMDVEAEAPEMESLSPVHQIGDALLHNLEYGEEQQQGQHQRTSGSTDTEFFDNVHSEHRRLAQQQQRSNLIEKIVRMSQKASGGTSSSGDVSLPPKAGKVKSSNVSLATDVTSPVVKLANKARTNAATTLSGKPISSASEITTPRKSDGNKDEWDVPSSGDEARFNKSARPSSATKTYGKRKRGSVSKHATTMDLFAGGPDELEVAEVDRSSSDRLPSAKKGKMVEIDTDESIIPDTNQFYIAPSSLTASQKEQYRPVHVSSPDDNNGGEVAAAPDYSMAPPPASKPKSSCATTIAYSTPSRYASSGPRPPWELAQPAVDEDGEVLRVEDNHEGTEIADNTVDASSRSDGPRRQRGGKKATRCSDGDDDELAGDDGWDSEDVGFHREVYKPRPSRRRSNGANRQEDARAAEPATNDDVMHELPPTQDPLQPEETTEAARRMEIQETPDIAVKAPAPAPDTDPAMVNGKPPPKKRGRKKKQPQPSAASDELTQAHTPGVSGAESGAIDSEPTAAPTAADPYAFEDEAPAEKPKKKRGRPRKSETPVKAAEPPPSVGTEQNTLPSTADPLAMEDEDFVPKATEPPSRGRSASEEIPPSEDDEDEDDEPVVKKRGGPPNAPRYPNPQKRLLKPMRAPLRYGKLTAIRKPSPRQWQQTKLLSRRAAAPLRRNRLLDRRRRLRLPRLLPRRPPAPATPSQQQGKVPYRVGLSKKSRVQSLLKIIRK
ncbi:threonine synthase [Apiospora aurea]|uniref:Threonine synthase n=1 Tax=Apiospora aurea TaxID=335848 RepID=A0ABR1Q8Y3_9PEZI